MSMCKKSIVLIIEDEQSLAEAIAIRLSLKGYDTLIALNGTKGLELAIEHTVDLILMDMRMPGIHGLELIEALQQQESTSDCPVIAMSASSCDKKEILASAAVDFIEKPYDGNKLMEKVGSILNSSVRR